MLLAPVLDGLSFGPFSLFDDGLSSTEVGIGRCNVVEALVVTLVVVVLDERFDLALGLRMERCAAHTAHAVGLEVISQSLGDAAGTVVAEQSRSVLDAGRCATRGF